MEIFKELTIPEKVSIARQRKNEKKGECAAVLGIHRETYSKKESGEIPFNLNEIAQLEEFFGIKIL